MEVKMLLVFLRICLLSLASAVVSSSGSDLQPPLPSPPIGSFPVPAITKGLVPLPSTSVLSPQISISPPPVVTEPSSPPFAQVAAPPPLNVPGDLHVPVPSASQEKPPVGKPPVSALPPVITEPSSPPIVQVAAPPPLDSQGDIHVPSPSASQGKAPVGKPPVSDLLPVITEPSPPPLAQLAPFPPSNIKGDLHVPIPSASQEKPPVGKPPVSALPPVITEPSSPPIVQVAAPPPLDSQGDIHVPSPSASQGKAPVGKPPVSDLLPVITEPSPPPLAQLAPFPPSNVRGDVHVPSPSAPQEKAPVGKPPVSIPRAPVPGTTPLRDPPANSPTVRSSPLVALPPHSGPRNATSRSPISRTVARAPVAIPDTNSPSAPPIIPPSSQSSLPLPAIPRNSSNGTAPTRVPINPVASPPRILEGNPPSVHPIMPRISPSGLPEPITSPVQGSPKSSPTIHPIIPGESPSLSPDHAASPMRTPSPGIHRKRFGVPVAAPTNEISKPLPPMNHSQSRGSSPAIAPSTPNSTRRSYDATAPSLPAPESPPNNEGHSLTPSPSTSFHRHHLARNKIASPAPESSYSIFPPPSKHQGPVITPSRDHAPSPLDPGSLVSPHPSPIPSSMHRVSPSPSLSPTEVFPFRSSLGSPKVPPLPPLRVFPPPPPNADCSAIVCTEPYTNTPPGSPCGCVWPMQVELRLSVALYTFFPLVAEFAQEIATGVFMKQSQVRIMGANAASEQPDKTVVLIDLVPLGDKFDNTTAFLTYLRFWSKKVSINKSLFGDYEVLYVHYPGLPSSPPLPPSGMTIIDDGPYSGGNGRINKPLGVDVSKRRHKNGLNGGTIAIIVLSASVVVGLGFAVAWLLLFKQRDRPSKPAPVPQTSVPSLSKPSGSARSITGSRLSSASLSFESSIAPYTGSAKTFTASEIEKATNNFDASRVLGEGGFGRVYSGVLEDGTKIAVKVLKRDDQQGGREFLAEVEMLSRLHHRNLVNLIGICTEDRNRCLVYELIPNGSVESHLHGIDKESSPLDWDARLKIALGAARGLAYLHEDSSPRVIHRDFKASNILLEHDFTPKVSDFGLARAALDEENRHISTRVMGTFGYVAPEYAMTGHLLVKSDVYSYGVVLLELLTGRKPVDMSQPPGQENLVAWTRPLLTSKEGLEAIIDPSLGPDVPFDSVAKVGAIASMCVQPEVSHRPFMGEVVQALKLVCNECDEAKEMETGSVDSTQEDFSLNMGRGGVSSTGSGHLQDPYLILPNYDSEPDTERGLPIQEMSSASARFVSDESSGSFRRHSSSGPLRTGRGRQFWQKLRRLSGGSISEHGAMIMLRPGSH